MNLFRELGKFIIISTNKTRLLIGYLFFSVLGPRPLGLPTPYTYFCDKMLMFNIFKHIGEFSIHNY